MRYNGVSWAQTDQNGTRFAKLIPRRSGEPSNDRCRRQMNGVRRGGPQHNEIKQNLALIELMLQTARLREIPPLHPKIDKVQQNLVVFNFSPYLINMSSVGCSLSNGFADNLK